MAGQPGGGPGERDEPGCRGVHLAVSATCAVQTICAHSYCGLLGGGQREEKLKRWRELLGLDPALPVVRPEPYAVVVQRLTGVDLLVCSACGVGRMVRKRDLEPRVGGQRRRRQGSVATPLQRAG